MKISKPVNLGQLDKELGGFGLNGPSLEDLEQGIGEVSVCEGSPVSEKELAQALDIHVPESIPPTDDLVTMLRKAKDFDELKVMLA